ncbi:MAG: hypothetical protein JST20_12020 [Bacteroidetes bacterium]|nr:hypothetical protein [Bacteroidota bacterium]
MTGGKITVYALQDMNGTALVGVPVQLQINTNSYSVNTTQLTDTNGETTFTVNPPMPCPYTVTATYQGVVQTQSGMISSSTDSSNTFLF